MILNSTCRFAISIKISLKPQSCLWLMGFHCYGSCSCSDHNTSPLCLPQSNMKSLEHELYCPVCKDIVKQPVVLPCQHSVCLMCASEVLVANGYPPPELPPEPNSPASTPNTRSPRQARRPTPKTEQRPIDRILRSGVECFYGSMWKKKWNDHVLVKLFP